MTSSLLGQSLIIKLKKERNVETNLACLVIDKERIVPAAKSWAMLGGRLLIDVASTEFTEVGDEVLLVRGVEQIFKGKIVKVDGHMLSCDGRIL